MRMRLLKVLMTFLACVIGLGTSVSAGSKGPELRIDPVLRQLAATRPGANVQVIVQQFSGSQSESAVGSLGGTVVTRLPIINGYTARLPARSALKLAARTDIKFVSFDSQVATTGKSTTGSRTTTVDASQLVSAYPEAVNVTRVWNQNGFTGAGVTVAVIDSGVTAVSDLGTRLLAAQVTNANAGYAADKFGHGTHVAGIIAGNGTSSLGKYIGVAPKANVVSVKMSDDSGLASTSDAINALQWVYDNRTKFNIRVANISASSGTALSYHDDPLDAAVEKLWFAGVIVVVSAGNRGNEKCALCYAPANDPYVITVGAVDDMGTKVWTDDFMPAWSSMGRTQDGFAKPDIMAPGAHMVSTLADSSAVLAAKYPSNIVDGKYFRMGGTSMAAPVVSGVIALMLEANPNLTPDQVKWLIANTARKYNGQLSRTPGIINGSAAVSYSNTLSAANQGLTPSRSLDPATGVITYSNVYWANVYWANVYWANSPDL